MALVELMRCPTAAEAALVQGALEAAGVASFVFDAEMSWLGDVVRCRVMVDDEDLAQARRILDQPPPEG